MTGPYDQAVTANLAHMGTALADWRAVPHVMTMDPDAGKVCPQVDWASVAGLTDAPTLYQASGGDACCGLCGHPIRNCYGAACDAKGWRMVVGSECVGRLTGTTGAEYAAQAVKADAQARAEADRMVLATWARMAFLIFTTGPVRAPYDRIRKVLIKATRATRNGRLATWASSYQDEVAKCRPGGEWFELVTKELAAVNAWRAKQGWTQLVPAA
jgi:hypothetical protein